MKILLSGIGGHMGAEVVKLAQGGYRGMQVVFGVDPNGTTFDISCAKSFDEAEAGVDVIVDFSNHVCTRELTEFAVKNNVPLVLATTGQTDEEKQMIKDASAKIPLFFASNYSVGVALLIELAKKAATAFPDAEIEILEKHHSRKLDAPSGTALTIAQEIKAARGKGEITCGRNGYGKREKDEIGIQSIRMGNVVGEHEVMIATGNQTISIKHEAHSRALFAEGALAAAEFIVGKPAGLYDMKSMLKG